MLEDVNRDYKNTINLLRSQLEIKNVMGNNNGHEQCPCNKTQTNTESYIEGKLDSIFERIKHEFEIREDNLRHQLEVMELKNKVVMLEMQQAITEKLYKQNDQVPIINKAEAESSKATTDHTNREHHRCSSINHKLVDQSVDISTQTTNNEWCNSKHSKPSNSTRDKLCTQNQADMKIDVGNPMGINIPEGYHRSLSPEPHLNYNEKINSDNVLENYYKKYPTQREINEILYTQKQAQYGNRIMDQNTKIHTGSFDQRKRHEKPVSPPSRSSQERKNHFLEIGPGNRFRKKHRQSL